MGRSPMNTLKLYLDSKWPEQHSDCGWVLLKPSGQVLQQGRSEPRYWPKGEAGELAVEVVLSADQAGCLAVDLPPGQAGSRAEVLAFATEDRLCGEIDDFHLVRGRSLGGNRWEVIVIPRQRIVALTTFLSTQGLSPDRMTVEADVSPPAADTWIVRWSSASPWLRLTGTWIALTAIEEPPAELAWCLTQSAEQAPREIRILLDSGQSIDETRWRNNLDVAMTVVGDSPANSGDTNLLQGEFEPARQREALSRAYRIPLIAAGIAMVLWSATLLAEWGWLSWRNHELRQQAVQLFRDTMPASTTLVDPALQIRRELDQRRLQQGLAADDDFLVLVAAIAGYMGDLRPRQLRYEDRILEVGLPKEKRVEDALRRQLEAGGLSVEFRPGKGGDEATTTYLAVSRKRDGRP